MNLVIPFKKFKSIYFNTNNTLYIITKCKYILILLLNYLITPQATCIGTIFVNNIGRDKIIIQTLNHSKILY